MFEIFIYLLFVFMIVVTAPLSAFGAIDRYVSNKLNTDKFLLIWFFVFLIFLTMILPFIITYKQLKKEHNGG